MKELVAVDYAGPGLGKTFANHVTGIVHFEGVERVVEVAVCIFLWRGRNHDGLGGEEFCDQRERAPFVMVRLCVGVGVAGEGRDERPSLCL